ncbi:DUF305 domain-containing protein [Actinoplanes sp. GCM10030250]|uniref:DUF305 domain-containing protein n=1 Tax=Actinoplanes sp. GCM10030250 TaxID=3273376 RepID=UPI00360EB32B
MTRQRSWMLAAAAAVLLGAGGILLVTRSGESPAPIAATATATPSTSQVPVILPGKPGESAGVAAPGVRAQEGTGHNSIDITFAQMMIAHHQQAVEMAGLAPGRAANTQLRSLAARMATTQQPEIEFLRDWLSSRGRPESDPAHDHSTMPGMQSAAAIAGLTGATGADFDRRFVAMMSDHHRGAVQMASDVLNGGIDRQLSEFANEMAVEQSAEINRMADLGVS